MVQQAFVRKNVYQDSVKLMRITEQIKELPGIVKVAAIMGTENNKATTVRGGFEPSLLDAAGPNDVLFIVDAATEADGKRAWEEFMVVLDQDAKKETKTDVSVTSMAAAKRFLSDANLAIISVPGEYATYEAYRALREGMHVQIFSDNVPLQDEVNLKTLGQEKGLLVMGPDCGTSIISGVPICFANVVRPGKIGIVGASGTGIQQVSTLIHQLGEGVSQAIGVGGRDLSDDVGGITTKMALELLTNDAETEVIVLLSKPPGAKTLQAITEQINGLGKPVVVSFLGQDASTLTNVKNVAATLEETATMAVSLVTGREPGSFNPFERQFPGELRERAQKLAASKRKYLRALYAGGTLAGEASNLLGDLVGNVAYGELKNVGHSVVDLGDDEFTQGRPHPMIDPSYRTEILLEQWADPTVGVILLDIILGYGGHMNPAEPVVKAIEKARAKYGDDVTVIASICGTDQDPQSIQAQAELLTNAGVFLFPTNAYAVEAAAQLLERSVG